MDSTIASAIAEVTQSRDQLLRAFANTLDDRVNWSPSPSARSPVQLVAHCAYSLGFIREMFEGTPYPGTMVEADAEHMDRERRISTREQALALLDEQFKRHIAFIESVTPEQLDRMITLPFSLGEMPLRSILAVGAMHTRSHLAQLEYLQTIYGDRIW